MNFWVAQDFNLKIVYIIALWLTTSSNQSSEGDTIYGNVLLGLRFMITTDMIKNVIHLTKNGKTKFIPDLSGLEIKLMESCHIGNYTFILRNCYNIHV
jgi:hypothetical protein